MDYITPWNNLQFAVIDRKKKLLIIILSKSFFVILKLFNAKIFLLLKLSCFFIHFLNWLTYWTHVKCIDRFPINFGYIWLMYHIFNHFNIFTYLIIIIEKIIIWKQSLRKKMHFWSINIRTFLAIFTCVILWNT